MHVPSDAIAAVDPEWGAGLLGDKAHSMVFDNRKIKATVPGWVATVPFAVGARQIIEWYDADPARRGRRPAGRRHGPAGRGARAGRLLTTPSP